MGQKKKEKHRQNQKREGEQQGMSHDAYTPQKKWKPRHQYTIQLYTRSLTRPTKESGVAMQPDSNGIRESEDFPMKHEQRDTREDRRTITKKMNKVINTNKINKKEKKNFMSPALIYLGY